MTDHEFDVVTAMQDYGGSFVKALAECFHRADHINFEILKEAFPDYWEQYERVAEKEL